MCITIADHADMIDGWMAAIHSLSASGECRQAEIRPCAATG